MYAQCPGCRTVFRITRAQIDARGGFVRCGRCHQVFDASGSLVEQLPQPPAVPAADATSPARGPDRQAVGQKKPRPGRGQSEAGPSARKRAKTAGPVESAQLPFPELELAPRSRARVPGALWAVFAFLAAAALFAQLAWAYRQELAQQNQFKPLVSEVCRVLDCGIREKPDVSAIELLDQTSIAPHPQYENLLRIRVAMINRGMRPLPYPLMEVTLTDTNGDLLARRTFGPRAYLEQAPPPGATLSPGVVVTALLDVTNPDGRAMGYEIRLLAP